VNGQTKALLDRVLTSVCKDTWNGRDSVAVVRDAILVQTVAVRSWLAEALQRLRVCWRLGSASSFEPITASEWEPKVISFLLSQYQLDPNVDPKIGYWALQQQDLGVEFRVAAGWLKRRYAFLILVCRLQVDIGHRQRVRVDGPRLSESAENGRAHPASDLRPNAAARPSPGGTAPPPPFSLLSLQVALECPQPAPRFASGEIWRPSPRSAMISVEAFVKANAMIVKDLESAKSDLMQDIESKTLFDGFGCPYSAYGYAFVIKGRLLEAPKSVERERRLAAVDRLIRKLVRARAALGLYFFTGH
jgi:hypothetical protein